MGMWSLSISSSDEYRDACDSFFAYYNSLENSDDLKKKPIRLPREFIKILWMTSM